MNKNCILIILLFSCCRISAQEISMEEIRVKYLLATTDVTACNELYNALKGKSDDTDLLSGYEGGVTMLMAKNTDNLVKKADYFKTGKKLLEDAISQNSNNIELRFLRFAIQENLPPILNYNKNLDEDRNYIIKYLPMLELRNLKKAIAAYMIKSEKTSEKEKASLKRYE